MSPSLAGKVCIVTGATKGIGKGIALQLGAAGAKVYVTGMCLPWLNLIWVQSSRGKLNWSYANSCGNR